MLKKNFYIYKRLEKKKKLIFLLKLKNKFLPYKIYKKRLALKKKILINNKLVINLLNNKLFIKLNIYRKRKNVFLSFANLLTGMVYSKYSCGHYYKRSLRRTYYAIESLFLNSKIFKDKKNFITKKNINNRYDILLYLMIKGNYKNKGFKKNLRKYVETSPYRIKKYLNLNYKAHNGIRKRSKRRK